MAKGDQIVGSGKIPSPPPSAAGCVGIVSASKAGLDEIISLLHREQVVLSHAICVAGREAPAGAEADPLLHGLRTCQDDAGTEIIILLSPGPSSEAARRVLDQVRRSEKPTVVCFLGSDPRLLWRAGAIPAARLDEAALRAVAWVRGWDQALISSQLEDLDEQMEAQAHAVHLRLDPARRRLRGLFTSEIFYQEARTLLKRFPVSPSHMALDRYLSAAERAVHLRTALTDPDTAVVLLDVVPGRGSAAELAAILAPRRDDLAVIAYVSGKADRRADQEMTLRRAGVIVAPSSAAAVHLAGRLATRRQS